MRRAESGGERFLSWAVGRRDGSNDLDRLAPDYRSAVRRCGTAIVRELDAGTGDHLDSAELGRLGTRSNVVRGDQSSPEFGAAAKRLADLLPDARLLDVTGSGHGVAVGAPQTVAEAVLELVGHARHRRLSSRAG